MLVGVLSEAAAADELHKALDTPQRQAVESPICWIGGHSHSPHHVAPHTAPAGTVPGGSDFGAAVVRPCHAPLKIQPLYNVFTSNTITLPQQHCQLGDRSTGRPFTDCTLPHVFASTRFWCSTEKDCTAQTSLLWQTVNKYCMTCGRARRAGLSAVGTKRVEMRSHYNLCT